MNIVYEQGRYVEEQEVKIPLSDRGFQYGDGAFATVQVQDGTALFLQAHLEQLQQQCQKFNLVMPSISEEAIEKLIHFNKAYTGIWRLKILVTGGDTPEPRLPQREGRMIAFLKPFKPQPFKQLKIGVFPIPYHTCHASFKSLAHLNRFYVMEEAHRQAVDDCVTQTESGYILEASFGNLFWVLEKTVLTPDPSLPLYFGITIKNVLQIAKTLGFDIRYVKMTLSELPQAAAAFRTNTMQGVRPIAQIGHIAFAQIPAVETLFVNGYAQLIEQQKKKADAFAPAS